MWKLAQVLAFTSIGKSTLYREIKAGRFPKPVLVSPRRAVWRENDILGFVAKKYASK